MPTKTVKKISSTNANELTMVDMAERDAQGRDIISTYATKEEIPSPSGGTVKYTHNIVVAWRGGSGSDYREGNLSFSFQDSNPNSYATSGYSEDISDIIAFFDNHLTAVEDKKYPMNGTVQVGYPIQELWFVTSYQKVSDMGYLGGGCIRLNSSKAITSAFSSNDEINYFYSAMDVQSAKIYDTVI